MYPNRAIGFLPATLRLLTTHHRAHTQARHVNAAFIDVVLVFNFVQKTAQLERRPPVTFGALRRNRDERPIFCHFRIFRRVRQQFWRTVNRNALKVRTALARPVQKQQKRPLFVRFCLIIAGKIQKIRHVLRFCFAERRGIHHGLGAFFHSCRLLRRPLFRGFFPPCTLWFAGGWINRWNGYTLPHLLARRWLFISDGK